MTENTGNSRSRQRGMLTTFTGVLILVLLTLMMFFAVRVGVFDQRISSNDMRQKLAFHAAESANQHAKEFFLANSVILASSIPNLMPGIDGWLSEGGKRWLLCDTVANPGPSHPCSGLDATRRQNMYFYSVNGVTQLPLDTTALLPGTTEIANVEALLCLLNIDTIPVTGCTTNTTDPYAAGYSNGSHYMITLLGRGGADCSGTDCGAEALVREQLSSFGGASGGNAPSIPVTTKTTFPPIGNAEIVPNPNGGGVGVPTSVWMNANPECSADGSIISPEQGSWATCEAHEWYEVDEIPENVKCPGSCSCTTEESISNTKSSPAVLGIDLVADDQFPCDLFKFFFGVPRASYEIVKGFAQVLSDCSTLGPHSAGIIWISGRDCTLTGNNVIGSAKAPVLLITAAAKTTFNGTAEIYGVIYVSDAEVPTALFTPNGNNTVYGQVIVDGRMDNYNGTFQVIYNENLVAQAQGGGGLGSVIGGWTDFHEDWK